MMKLTLQELGSTVVLAAADYDNDSNDKFDTIARSARRLCPEAAASYKSDLAGVIRVTDMWRNAASGLRAILDKGGRSPGYSGHNYGRSIDISVSDESKTAPGAMQVLGFSAKYQLDDWMHKRGWSCWRLDGKRIREEWHYDFLRPSPIKGDDSGDDALQRQLVALYGPMFKLKQKDECPFGQDEVQIALAKLGLYHGAIDNDHGRMTREALLAFQRHWMPFFQPTGVAGAPTQRVLAFVTAELEILPVAA